jgi:hypothetical protein
MHGHPNIKFTVFSTCKSYLHMCITVEIIEIRDKPSICMCACLCFCTYEFNDKEIVVSFFLCTNFCYWIIKGLKPSVIFIHYEFPQYQPTNTHNCHLIHNNIFKTLNFSMFWTYSTREYLQYIHMPLKFLYNNSVHHTYSVYKEESHQLFHICSRWNCCLVIVLYNSN